MKKYLAIFLCLTMVLCALPLNLVSFATPTEAGYGYAETLGVSIGDNIYDHDLATIATSNGTLPTEWELLAGANALGSKEQGGTTKAGYGIYGGGTSGTSQIKIPAENYVVKISLYQDTAFWNGMAGRINIRKYGKNVGSDTTFKNAEIQLGGYKRTADRPRANGSDIIVMKEDGTTNWNSSYRVDDIGGGFGSDGNGLLTIFIYSLDGTNYYVREDGTLIGSNSDLSTADENYFYIQGEYMYAWLSDFEVYKLKISSGSNTPDDAGFSYAEALGVGLGKSLYNHDFTALSAVPAEWSVALNQNGSAPAIATLTDQGTKKGYMITGANGNQNAVQIELPTKNFVAKISMLQNTTYWGGTGGRIYIEKYGKNSGSSTLFLNAQASFGGYNRTGSLPQKNGGAFFRFDHDGGTSTSTADDIANIGGGFGADGNSTLTIYIYSLDGFTYYVNESGELIGGMSYKDGYIGEENYLRITGDWMAALVTEFTLYSLNTGGTSDNTGENLIENGEFNTDTAVWTPLTAGTTLTWDNEGFATATVKAKGNCCLYSNLFEVTPGDNLKFSYEYKSSNNQAEGMMSAYIYAYKAETVEGLDMSALCAAGKQPSGYDSSYVFVTPKKIWQGGEISYTVPEGYSYAMVSFGYRGAVAVGEDFSVDNVSVVKVLSLYDRINIAVDEEDLYTFKKLIKDNTSGVTYEIMTINAEFLAKLKAYKAEKGADLTAEDIYAVHLDGKVDDIGNRLELFVEDSLIDKSETTADFELQAPTLAETDVMDMSGYFRCDDVNNAIYTGSFDMSVLNENTRPWENMASISDATILKDGDTFKMYYGGADDEIITATSYVQGEDPLANHLNVCYAESKDGINWVRPELNLNTFYIDGVNQPNNILLGRIDENFDGGRLCSFSPFIDNNPDCPADERFKAILITVKAKGWGFLAYSLKSADGIHWEKMNDGNPIIDTDNTELFDSLNVAFYSTERQEYLLYFRRWVIDEALGRMRTISVMTSPDLISWQEVTESARLDFYSDMTLEELEEYNQGYHGNHPDNYQYYTNGVTTYDRAPHLFIATPTRYLGDSTGYQVAPYFAASRDGENFKLWNTKLVENLPELDRDGNRSNYGLCGIVRTSETEYSFYAGKGFYKSQVTYDRFTFRVDGFVAAKGDSAGQTVVTTPITFSGNSLILNYKATGSVKAQLTDVDGNVIEGFGYDDCVALVGDEIAAELVWSGDLSTIDQPVKINFLLTDAELYSYKFEEKAVASGGVSILTDTAAEAAGHQAMRIYYGYNVTDSGKIAVNGNEYSLLERGMIISSGAADSEMVYGNSKVITLSKKDNFNNCWRTEGNAVIYSNYFVGFRLDDTRAVKHRGFIRVDDGSTDGLIIYTDITENSISAISSVH